MRGDFTRPTHDRRKRFTKVLQQQGRLLGDWDWNEAQDLHEELRLSADGDAIGPAGAPKRGGGFEPMVVATPSGFTLAVTPGRIYVGGLLCEADGGQFAIQAVAG